MASISFLEILIAIICFLVLICFSIVYNSNYNTVIPINWPVIGMLPGLLRQIHRLHDWATVLLQSCQCTFLFKGPWFANMDMLITADPANIHHIMSANFSNYPKGPEFKRIFEVLGDGIFNSDSELWKVQRKATQFLITHRQFYKFLVRITQDKVQKGLVPVLDHVCEKGFAVDLQDLFQRFTFDATCLIVTGHDPGCLATEFPEIVFAKAMDDAEEAIFYRHVVPEIVWKLQKLLNIGQERKHSEAWKALDHVTADIISSKKQELTKSAPKPDEEAEQCTDFLTSYMRELDVTTIGLKSDDQSLRDTIINLMLAGRDTTSSGLSWFFWLLSKNPHAEETIREELKATLTSTEGSEKSQVFDIEVVKGLVYLHGALCESLRLYPPVPFQSKSPVQPETLPSGHRVYPKMKILFFLYEMGRMPAIWGDDCLEFKPERWISERGKMKHEPSYKFLAFNAGPRTCLGKDVAFTQMKAVAAAIIYNYNVQVVHGQNVTPAGSILLHMKHGLKAKVAKRWT